jgi:guanylate kinase
MNMADIQYDNTSESLQPKITLLIGKSASGKDTLYRRMIKTGANGIVSCTTRSPRPREIDGKDYFFLDREKFLELVSEGKIFEYRSYDTLVDGIPDTWYYGSKKQDLEQGKDYVAVVEVDGAMAYAKAYGADLVDVILVEVSDDAERTRRARRRPGFNEAEWVRRMEADNRDFSTERLAALEQVLGKNLLVYKNDTRSVPA